MALLPTGTLTEVSNYLIHGYWEWQGEESRKFNIGSSGQSANNGVIYYNYYGWAGDPNGLTPAGRHLADAAFAVYEAITGIDFRKTASTGTSVDIFFGDSQEDAYAEAPVLFSDGHTINYAAVNISTDWLETYGTTIGSYSCQTYLHEIGHALGLGHLGPYNGVAEYPANAKFLNDSWQMSVMSYFSQTENTAVDASFAYLISPMLGDLHALERKYGIKAFTSDTTWGFNTNITTPVFADLATLAPKTAFTIVDSGGVDTLDFSGYLVDQRITLRTLHPSDVGGKVGNMIIASGSYVENCIGGLGDDTLIGNTRANRLTGGAGDDELLGGTGKDRLGGGEGADIFAFASAAEAGLGAGCDVITDFLQNGDRIDLSLLDADLILKSNQAFQFIGQSGFSGSAGELRCTEGLVAGDMNGDAQAEFEIQLANGALLLGSDFFL